MLRGAHLMIGRRMLLGGGLCLIGASRSFCAPSFEQAIVEMESGLGGRIGVAALDTGSGRSLSHRGGERFAMCSSFKWLLAAAVLSRVDRGELGLDQRIAYTQKDILGVAPVTQAHLAEGRMRLEELCGAAVEFSDNTAANLLLGQIGGPPGLTRYLRGIGDPATRLDRMELALNSNLPGDPRDTTMPDAMIVTMKALLLGDALKPGSRERLVGWLKNSKTGLGRLRAGLPKDWIVGDKTGTGANGPCNDNAIAWPPGRPPILIVAYVDGRRATAAEREAPHAKIAALIAKAFA